MPSSHGLVCIFTNDGMDILGSHQCALVAATVLQYCLVLISQPSGCALRAKNSPPG